jgi:hypothetical protein
MRASSRDSARVRYAELDMKMHRILAAAALGLVLAACKQASPDELIARGNKALGSGDSETALEKFDQAIAALAPLDPKYVDAKFGAISAMVADKPRRAFEDLKQLADTHPQQVGAKQFLYIGDRLVSAKHYWRAVEVIHEGIQRFPSDAAVLELVIKRIELEAAMDERVKAELMSFPCYMY